MTTIQPPVAIVGMAVLLPGAPDLESYEQNLINGVDAISDVPEHRLDLDYYQPDGSGGPAPADRIYCRRGGFIDDLIDIDPTEFGMMPNSVTDTEPDQLIALKVAAAAVADAGGAERLPARDRIGVIIGRGAGLSPGWVRMEQRFRTSHQIIHTLSELVPDLTLQQLDRIKAAFTSQVNLHRADSVIGLLPALVASRIANRLDLRGPAYTVDAACAASLLAVDHAVGELASRRCDMVVVGGVHHGHDILAWNVLAQLHILSPSQRMRPFDRAADGILASEGTGMVALKRLADAERDGDRIYAVIRGTGVTSDGRGESLLKPEPERQALAQQRAWQAAGLDPAEPGSLGLLEGCGAATPIGDQAELAALARVFGKPAGERAVIGSVKSMIGHTMQAAGIASLIKTALAVCHGVLLPTLGCEDPHPALAGTRFRPIGSAQPWELGGSQRVRRAAVNAFGFGGVNVHVVVEQHRAAVGFRPPRRPVAISEPERVLRLAAGSPAGIIALLDGDGVATEADGCRLGVVGPTQERLAFARRVVTKGEAWRGGNHVWFSPHPLLRAYPGARIGFVFPGLPLEMKFEPRVDDVALRFGWPLPEISADEPGRRGAAVITVSRLLDQALRRLGIVPDMVAGYSLGELAAMISAGMFSDAGLDQHTQTFDQFMAAFDQDALRAARLKSVVLSCSADQVAQIIAAHEGMIVSQDNSPSQVRVCGPAAAVDELVRSLHGQHVLAQPRPTLGLHTPFMAPYLAQVREAVTSLQFHPPVVPIWSSTSAARYPQDEAEVRELFVRHLAEPVRFRQVVEAMYADGARVFVQVGDGQLDSLINDTLRGREHLAITAHTTLRSGLDQLRRVVTALWVEGGQPLPVDVAPAVGARPCRQPVKLDFSTSLVSLNGAVPVLARSTSRLDQLAAQLPLAAELAELLRETASSAAAVIGARAASREASTESEHGLPEGADG